MITEETQASIDFLSNHAGKKLTLGSFIMAIRQGEEESQVEFAKKLGVSRQVLCDIEHGRRFLRPKKAAEYAEILGYSKQQFVRLCLQELIEREGLKMMVEVENAA